MAAMNKNAHKEIQSILSSLTEAQLQAAGWNDGPLLVLAGPGSGKTRVLTTRIARLLTQSEEESYRILALTFTNRAADEMRARILELVPNADDRLFIGTFHSFCVDFLRKNAKFAGIGGNFTIYSSNEDRIEIVGEAIRSSLEAEEQYGVDAKKALTAIDYCKSKLISPVECLDSFKDKERGAIFKKVYFAYEDILKKYNALDFNSLIFYTIKILKERPFLAKRIRQTYRYWCLDEFQDTNQAQFSLIENLADDSFDNIFVVADDDQIIYQWNGATYQRLEQFNSKFHPESIQLPTNFRCPPEIVSLANLLVSRNVLRTANKDPLVAKKTIGDFKNCVRMMHFPDDTREAEGIVDDISKRYPNPDSVVVLGRNRSILEKVVEAASQRGLNARIIQRCDDFQSSIFNFFVFSLKLSVSRGDSRILQKLLLFFNEAFETELPLDAIKLRADSSHGDYFRAWLEEAKIIKLQAHYSELLLKIDEFLLSSASYRALSDYLLNWVDTEYLDQADNDASEPKMIELKEDVSAWTGMWREIHQAIGSTASIDMFLQELELRSKEPPLEPGSVALMTIHASKGNEFSHVYLCGLAEDILPSYFSKKQGDQSPQLEEERRNCFVAITRAKESLTLTFADRYRGWTKAPSRFLYEMSLLSQS